MLKSFSPGALFHSSAKAYEKQTREKLALLLASENCSPEHLREVQREKLQKLLRHAFTTVPAYREYAVLLPDAGEDFDPFAIMPKLPPLAKGDFSMRPEDFRSEKKPEGNLQTLKASSLFCPRMDVSWDNNALSAHDAARRRALGRFSLLPKSRVITIIDGTPGEKLPPLPGWIRLTEAGAPLRCTEFIPGQCTKILSKIRHMQPDALYAEKRRLLALAAFLSAEHRLLTAGEVKVVISTGEPLDNWERRKLEKAFTAPIAEEYAAPDAGMLANSCSHGHLHINTENIFAEVVDPFTLEPAAPGRPGLLLLTDLNNYASPRLRWRQEDVVILGEDDCPCGSHLPVLKTVMGKENRLLIDGNNEFVSGSVILEAAEDFPTLKQFSFVQDSPTSAMLQMTIDTAFPEDRAEAAAFAQRCQELLPGIGVMVLYRSFDPDAPPADRAEVRRDFILRHETPVL